MVIAPDVNRVERLAFVVVRWCADQPRRTGRTGKRRDRAVQAKGRQLSGLAGLRPEAATPQQTAGIRLREPAWKNRNGGSRELSHVLDDRVDGDL
jgi:hypothetical protein